MTEPDEPVAERPEAPSAGETGAPAQEETPPAAGTPPRPQGEAPAAALGPEAESAETPSATETPEAPREPERLKPARRFRRLLAEREPELSLLPRRKLRSHSRRDFLAFGAGAAATAAGLWWFLPEPTKRHLLSEGKVAWLDSLEARLGATEARRESFLNSVLTFDDDVAEALFSPTRRVRTFEKSDVTPLRNNYEGKTPSPDYLPGWGMTVEGLASGRVERLTIDVLARFPGYEQVTRLICVEGWSAVAWWGGLRFADFLRAYPPTPGARWVGIESSVNLDVMGRPEPYYVSIDLATARHPQTLLATHHNGRPLTVEHGAPVRLVAPMKLGLKNIKAITKITYSAIEPPDYWNERGYSKYDGL